MSTTPIWNLKAPRHELGGATKGTIYLSKIGIGAGIAFVLWMGGLSGDAVMAACAAVFVTGKVTYYLNTGERPTGLDDVADWCCDGVLHFAFYGLWNLIHGDLWFATTMLALWLVTYPWSCE